MSGTTAATRRKLEGLRDDIVKRFGANAAVLGTDIPSIRVCHSGSLALDFALGVGGVPCNRVIELIGDEGGGKTTLALLLVRQLLLSDPRRHALFLDLEHKLTPEWAEQLLGRELLGRVLYLSPDSAEEATDMYVQAVRTGTVQCAIFDSIGGAPTIASLAKSAEVGEYGGNSRAISRFARIAANFSARYECLTVGINQMRVDMSPGPGQKINAPGGLAWRHACIARILLRRGGERFEDRINGETVQVGYDIKARVFKNQMAAPGRTAVWNFFNLVSQYGPVGIDTTEECIRLAELVGVVAPTGGGWYAHPALPDGRVKGRRGLRDTVLGDEPLRMTLVSEVLAALADGTRIAEVAPITETDAEERNAIARAVAETPADDDRADDGSGGPHFRTGLPHDDQQ